MRSMNKRLNYLSYSLIAILALGLLCTSPGIASDPLTFGLSWQANTEAYLDGYEIYFKDGSVGAEYELIGEVYLEELEDPDYPSIIITDLYNGTIENQETTLQVKNMTDNSTYFFALTAFDIEGNTSDFSEEVCVKVVEDSVTGCRALDGDGTDDGDDGSALEDLLNLEKLGCFIGSIDPADSADRPPLIWICTIFSIAIAAMLSRPNKRSR